MKQVIWMSRLGLGIIWVAYLFSCSSLNSPIIQSMINQEAKKLDLQLRTVSINKQEYSFFISNHDKKVPYFVLVHGFSQNKAIWLSLIKSLGKERFRYLVPDMRNFNQINLLDFYEKDDLESQAAYLHQLIQYLIPKEKIILLGPSMGGAISSQYAINYPQNIQQLFIFSSLGDKAPIDSAFYRYVLYNDKKRMPLAIEKQKYIELVYSIVYSQKHVSTYLEQYLAGLHMSTYYPIFYKIGLDYLDQGGLYPLQNKFSQIKVPTFIFWGTRDKLFDVTIAAKIHKSISNSQLEYIEGAPHELFSTQHQYIAQRIRKILEEKKIIPQGK